MFYINYVRTCYTVRIISFRVWFFIEVSCTFGINDLTWIKSGFNEGSVEREAIKHFVWITTARRGCRKSIYIYEWTELRVFGDKVVTSESVN